MTGTGVEDLLDEPAEWPVARSRDLYRGDWVLALRADTLRAPERPDQEFDRYVVELPGAVMVLAVDADEQVVVLRQYRHAVRTRLVELPAGLLDVPGEDPVVAARRELREETALVADSWRHLVTVLPSPGISTETHVIYLARGLHDTNRGGFEPEHEEAEMEVRWVPVQELADSVLAGGPVDGHLAIAVLLATGRGLAGSTRSRE